MRILHLIIVIIVNFWQGSENVAGLMTLSMSEFLSRAEEVGNCISFSLYEVVQDHVFDLLDSKKPEISVLEGAHGKVILKGLSKASNVDY